MMLMMVMHDVDDGNAFPSFVSIFLAFFILWAEMLFIRHTGLCAPTGTGTLLGLQFVEIEGPVVFQ